MIDRYRNYQPRRVARRPQRKKHRGLFVFVCAAVLFTGGRTVWSKIQSPPSSKPTTNSTPKPEKKITAEPIASSTWNDLNQNVTAVIDENSALDISVAVIDIGTNTKANYGIQDNFAGASTTKVLTAVTFLHEAEEGRQSITKSIGSKSAKEHLRLMINQSNNESWAALNRKLTGPTLESFAKSLGLSSYKYKTNTITASDAALLLQKLYSGDVINETNKKLLLSFMQKTNNEEMIPQVAPDGSTLYHKYGQLEDRLHDSAIIEYKDRPVIIVVYTKGGASDGSNYKTRTALVRELAKTVIDTIYQ